MANIISEECISCGSCQEECPVEAISEGESIYVIDEELCVDCGACVPVCPVEAISLVEPSGDKADSKKAKKRKKN